MIEYSIDERQGLVEARMSGSNSCADLMHHFGEVYRNSRYKPSLKTIFLVDDDATGPLLGELMEAKRFFEVAAQAPNALKKWAVVIPSRFKRAIVEFMMKGVRLKPVEMRFFEDEATALAWLRER